MQHNVSLERPKHVVLGFNLLVNGEQVSPNQDQVNEIWALFPTCYAVGHLPPFLVIRVQELPPKPWPISVAGLPLFLTESLDEQPLDWGIMTAGPKVDISAELCLWKNPSLDAIASIFRFFSDLGATIDRIQWWGVGFRILATSEPFSDWRQRLPRYINKLRVGYTFGDISGIEKALRKKQPSSSVKDDSIYDDLRPGIKLNFADPSGVTIDTTSGVCVKGPNGLKYMTVAKHGFPGQLGAEVWHPDGNGILLGHVVEHFGESDIALCKLEAGLSYAQEPFCETAQDPVITFQDLGDVMSKKLFDFVYMDTPFTGLLDGQLVGKEFLRLPVDVATEKIQYAMCSLVGLGSGNADLAQGCCGGVLWDDDHNVLGQFRFAADNGVCYFPAYDTIRSLGFKLSH